MKKKGLIVFDILMAVVVLMGLIFGMQINIQKASLEQSRLLAENVNRNFELEVAPEYQKKLAGETAKVKISLKDINMGEIGLNNIVGYLSYDESLFDEVNIQGAEDWIFEQNQDKNHEMYGKFVIYTMKEGVTADQDILNISLKLKSDVKPQKTEVKFTGIKSSDGEVSVDEKDKSAVIEIYEPGKKAEPEVKPEPEQPKQEEPAKETPVSIKTGDNIMLLVMVLAVATIVLNVMIILKKNTASENRTGLKVGIASAIFTITVALLLLAVTSFAHNSEITNLINSLNHKESWLNSEKYLVTDDTISRIAPLTNVADISDKFNKSIEIYKKDSNEKVTDGIVSTGMRITDGNDNYDAVVLGDIDGNGESDHIELTKIIRNSLDNEKYRFSNVEKLAADMNIDNTIDEGDVNTSIRYILYGELNMPEFEQVAEPKIEVVGGTFNNVIDAYEDTVTVKITAQDSKATSTKYKIEGTTTSAYAVIESGDTFELTENGVYKVSAYSYGELGNRSEIPYEIIVKKNPNNEYRIITKTENADGTYAETTENHTGRIGQTVTAGETVPEGYQINQAQSTLTGVIDEDNVIELVVTLDRKEYTLTLQAGDFISAVRIGEEQNSSSISKNIKFGKTADIDAIVSELDGYTTTFDRWISSDRDTVADNANKNAQIEMPKENITLTATASRVTNDDTKYTVEYYYQENGTYKDTADGSKIKNGETDSTVAVDDIDKTPTREEYVLDESKTSDFSGRVKGDGTLVLKVYFKQDFKVTYSKGEHGTFDSQVTEHLAWGADTPTFVGELTHEEGYDFDGWNKTPADSVTESIEYVAKWKEHEYDITYTLNGGSLSDGESNPTKYTISTESFTLKNPTRTGYTFKGWTGTGLTEQTSQVTVAQGSTGDRAYEANWEVIEYDITYNLNKGQLLEGKTNPDKYTVETPTFTLNNPAKTGYTFLGWTGTDLTEQTTSVTVNQGSIGERSYEANWRANSGITYHVKYYLEKLDSTDSAIKENYDLEEDVEFDGTTDEDATAEIKPYTGFTYDASNPNNKITGKIAGDGSLVLEVYYTRNSYILTLDKDENIDNVTGAGTYKFGATAQIDATLKAEVGYTISFVKWVSSTANSEGPDKVTDKTDKSTNIVMPAGDVTLTATSSKVANDVTYTVEYYYQENGTYADSTTLSREKTAKTGTDVEVDDIDKTPTKPEYVLDESKTSGFTGKVKGDGSLVLKVYFKQDLKVTYSKGVHGTFDSQVTDHIAWGTVTPAFNGELTHDAGYEFTGWDKTVENYVTETVEYVAQWKATEYDITYTLNGGSLAEGQTNPDKYTVETETFTLKNPTRPGYTFKGWTGTDLAGQTTEVTVNQGSTGDRAYEANWETIEYDITYDLNDGHLLEGKTNPDKYTVETPTFTLNNPVKTGYTFLGWTGTDLAEQTTVVTVNQGSIGDRSYTANWRANSGVAYHVKYYLEKLESTDSTNKNNYDLEEDVELDGTTNEDVTAEIKPFIGFTYDVSNPNNKITGKIAGDGSLVLEVYYTRNSYTLTLDKDENIDNVTGAGTYKFGATAQIDATLKTEVGYTISFEKWVSSTADSEGPDKVTDKTDKSTNIIMPAGDVTLTATSSKVANDVTYTVEYYYQEDGIYSNTTTLNREKTAKTDTDVEVDDIDKTPTKPEYVLDESKTDKFSGKVKGDGTLVLKVYFKQDLKVTYSKGEHGTFDSQVTEHLAWGADTPAFNGELTHEEGYDFNGWNEVPADKVTESVEYVAQWKEHEYDITYVLNGGSLAEGESNPTKYTISTESFTLKNPTRTGYTFKGWTGTDLTEETTEVTVSQGSTGDRTYEANWEVIEYDITYDLRGGDLPEGQTNPDKYTVETLAFTLNNPAKIGYTFTGWTGTDLTEETTSVTIAKGSTGDRSYTANWRANSGIEYKVRYYLENLDSTDSTNKDNYTQKEEVTKSGTTNEDATAEIKTYTGFTFDENNPNNKLTDKIAGDGSLVLEVYYTRNSYTVALEKDENVDSTIGEGTYKFEAPVSIDATLKTEQGYTITFVKWKSSTADSTNSDQLDDQFEKNASFTMPAGDVTLTAMSNKTANEVDYKVEFYYEEQGEYPEQVTGENVVTRQAETDSMVYVTDQDKTTTKPTYVWDESKNGDLSGKVKGDGTLVLKVYFKQEFTVTYSKGAHGTFETQTTSNLRYNADTPEFIGEKTHEEGYEFTGWDKTVENKVTQTVEYVAQWNATVYTIEYDLHDGTLGQDIEGHDITNPETYTVTTETFTLNNPTKPGYTFKGWTGTGLTAETETVTIAKGSTGNRSYEANWEVIDYDITYDLKDGRLLDGVSNPGSYNIETPTFTLNNPVKTGYTFLGWTGTGIDNLDNPALTEPQETVTVAQGSMGDRAYTANWQANTGVTYHVKYYTENLNSTDKDNPANYTLKEDKELDGTTNEEVTAEIKTYTGFTYDANNPNNKITDRIAGDGSLVLKVYYTRNSYELTMAKDANIESVAGESTTTTTGNSVDETTLKGTFKYEEPVQISATLKTEQGYTITFKEWQSTSTAILQADEDKKSAQTNFTMPAEDVTVTATSNREANTVGYRVEYYYEGENGYAETPTYTDETRTAKVATTVSVTNADKVADERNPGFRFDENADNVLTTTIPTSGTAVLKVYFKKAIFTLKVVAGDKVTEIKLGEDTAGEGETLQGTYMYGTSITIDATVGTQEGYEITFEKWKSSDTTLMADNTTKNLTFTMPDGDITLTAIASVTPLDASYTVEYYYQANGEYPENPGEGNVVTRTGKTGQQVSITNADKEPITSGYVYDTNADNIETTDVNGLKPDGSTTLKVHFKEQFTVKYLPGDHANFEGTTIRNLDYNSEIPGYTGSTEGKDGFIFDSWKLTKIGETEVTDGTEIPTTVKANLEYTAQWKAMPTPEVTHAPTTWTNQNVTVTITAPESFEDYDIEYKIDDNPEWNTYNEPFEVEQNCVIHARLGKDDNKGEAVDHPVTNIDKVNPEFANTPTFTINNNTALVKANVTDNLSGVVEYGMRKDIYTGFTKHTCANTLSAELTFDDAHESGTYELYIKDAAGNTNTTTVEVVIPVHNVAKIVSAPAGFESLIGTEYTSLTEALSTSDEAAQAGNVKIEIIDYIDNEENTILNGRDYTINLNNYTVKNQEGKTAMTVSGKLRLVDENALGEGTLSSPFGLGVYITLDGELTLGKDGDGTPGIFSPIVEGGSYGIKKEINYNAEQVYDENKDAYYYPEGVLNFYDGKVIGGTAAFMIQRVNDTPSMYDPTVVTNQNTGNQESTLAIVSGVEAVIGKKRYMLLEDAVADANNVIGDSNTQVEITVVKDISKDANHKVVVDETKNIKLNTNGYSITTTTNDYVIKNYGKLEVYDSNADKNGTVCTKLADDVDIVTGERTTWDGRYVINNGKDFSFTFDIAATQKYKMAVTARYLNRGSAVYLDGTEIYNFVNSGAGNDWTTFNLDLGVISEGEHTIRIYSTGSTPYYEKFEIKGNEPVGKIVGSSASTIYNGISDAAKEDIEYENVDLTQAVANGTYYFETRAEGGLISNNGGVASTALSYIVLDLTDKTGMYEVVVDSLISSRANNDYGYVTVSYDSALKPDANYTYGRKIYKSGNGIDERDKFNLAGGEKYYINFGYRKSANSASYSDCFIIKNIKVGKIEKAGTLTITSGNYQNTAPNKTYYEVFDNDGLMYVNGGTIRTDNYYLEGIVNGKNSNSGYLEVNGGNIYTHYGRNIVNQGLALAKLNKGSFGKATNTYQNSYDEILYNNCGALYTLTDDVVLNGVTGIETVNSGKSVLDKGKINAPYQNGVVTGANGRSYVNNVTINASSYGIYSNSDSAVTYINGANIIKASTGIYNYYNGRIEIDNVTMTTTDGSGTPTIQYGIYNNSSGKIIVNNADVYSKNHAIYNYINGTIEINDGTYRTQSSSYATAINANYNNNSSATLIVRGGTITGPTNAIYNLNNGRVTVTGGFLESTGSNAIASVGTGSVTIGSNDGEVSKTTPVVKSHAYGAVYNARGTFNYYDGVLVGLEDTVIRGILSDMPENYELVREIKEDNLQYITLGIPTNYVAKIAAIDNPDVSVLDSSYYKLENGYYYFITLKAAVDACSKTNASQIDLLSAVSVYRKITVDSQHDITIKTNGNKIYMNCAVDFENNGKLKIEGVPKEDGDTTKEIISYGGMLFKNNEGAQLDLDSCSISDSSEQGVSSNYRKIFDNFGTLNISNMIVRVYYGSKNTHMYAYSIYNEQSGNINLTNVELTGNAQYPIYNYGADKTDENEVVTYSAVMTNCKYTYENGGRPYGPQNMGTGTFLIDGCTIDNWGSSYSTDNYSTGTIIMRNSTNNGYMYNRSSGYVEIDNTEVKDITYNQSTGKILVKGELSKLSRMDNNNASGTIEIQAGTVKYSSSSPTINNSGKLIVSGGTISNTYNYSQSYGINNTSSAVATIYGSNTIITSNYVSGINNTGTLTLGVEGDGVDSRPIVKGKTYGVYSTGTFNFFDGIIEGATATSIGGRVTRTEEGYLRVIYGSEEIYDDGTEDKYTVPANKEISVLEHIEIAYVESTGRTYTTLKAALADTAATDTIKLINDVTLSANTESLTIPEGKNITFDLNGKNIQAGNARLFINNGTFKIKDSTSHIEDDELIEGSIVSGNNIILENNGIASVDNGTYRLTVGGSSSEYKSIFENNGTLTITGGTTKLESQYCIAIRNNENATVTMNNMSITLNVNYGYGIYNNKGTATMKSGSITNNASYCYSAYNANTGDITIEGGTIDKSNGVYNASTGTCTIKDGATINAQVYNYSTGTIDILGGTITHGDNAVYNSNSGTINIKKGTITGSGNTIYNTSSGTININGEALSADAPIRIIGRNNNDANAVTNYGSGTINITGFVEIESTSGNTSYTERGIYNNTNNGTINIGKVGELDNRVKVTSTNHAVVNWGSGTLNYYGGVLTAPTAVYGYITRTSDVYEIVRSIDENNREVYVVGELEDAISIGNDTYSNIADALAEHTTGTIVVEKNIVIANDKVFTITNQHNIELDMNGHIARIHTNGAPIVNEGTLKFNDKTAEASGKLSGYSTLAIQNKGNFEMANGEIYIVQKSGSKIITNEDRGNINITGGTIYVRGTTYNTDRYYGIYATGGNSITMSGGSIKLYSLYYSGWWSSSTSYAYGIYATVPIEDVTVTGGSFTNENDRTTYAIYLDKGGDVILSGNTSMTTHYGVYANSNNTTNVTVKDNVNITASDSIVLYSSATGTVDIKGGTMKNISVGNYATVNMKGGFCNSISGGTSSTPTSTLNVYEGTTINNGTNVAIKGFSIVNIYGSAITGGVQEPSKEFNMTGGSITGGSYGLRLNNSNVKAVITGGTITATSGPGIQVASGTLTLGVNGENEYPDTAIPAITGSTYGVENSGGTFNFYDGILTGNTYATNGTVTDTPEMFTVIYSDSGRIGILGIEATFEQVATVNGIYYNDLTGAVNAAINVNGRVELCKDITTSTNITIPADASITIDLYGFSINGYTQSGALITNNGTLVIEDTTDEGVNESTIRNYTGVAIVNNGNLVTGTNDGTVYTSAPIITGTTVALVNHGTWDFVDGKITRSEESGDIITNDGTARKPQGYSVVRTDNVYTLVAE